MLSALPAGADEREAFFESRIRPVLIEKCFTCHGGDKTSSGLRVDARAHLIQGGDSGAAIVPGDAEASRLLLAIRYADPDLEMPPKRRLPDDIVSDFARWIAEGAVWPDRTTEVDADNGRPNNGRLNNGRPNNGRHWAFQPLDDGGDHLDLSSPNPIDGFLGRAHRERGLEPLGPAARQVLIRRASFDLTGLPPTREQVEDFVNDERPDAFSRVVDRLLESPQYAERWARHWLDVVRYADTAGDDSDYPIPQATLYRDYVIDSFQDDKPYDDFIREQIAGDILACEAPPEVFRERTIATGFLAHAKRFATGKHEDMHLIIEDTLHTIGQTFLGLTFRCARCHDHKYDPTTQADYYALYGFFASTVYPHPGGESDRQPSDLIPLIPPDDFAAAEASYLEQYQARMDELEAEMDKISTEASDPKERRRLLQPLRDELQAIRDLSPWETTPLAYAVKEGKSVDVKIQIGGDPRRLRDRVRRGVPRFLPNSEQFEITAGQSGRLDLADWLTSRDNPLTARVMVNRIWQHHFGKGIVASPSNFGIQGEVPTHPELLDWLALRFMESDWSVKSMHRLIMSSAAYQRSSGQHDGNASRDPANEWCWRFDRRRMDAESIRDSMLLIAGNLDLCRPGPHPFPATKNWRFSAHRQFKAVYPSNHRSIYLMVQRLHPHPFLSLFNGPSTTASVAVRDASTVPLQALFMANSRFVHTQAEGVARGLLPLNDNPARINHAYWQAFSRPATEQELSRGLQYLERYKSTLAEEGASAEETAVQSLASLARTLFASNEFVYVD